MVPVHQKLFRYTSPVWKAPILYNLPLNLQQSSFSLRHFFAAFDFEPRKSWAVRGDGLERFVSEKCAVFYGEQLEWTVRRDGFERFVREVCTEPDVELPE